MTWSIPDRLPLPRAPLGVTRSPVERVDLACSTLWLKREDRNAPRLAGNKARALQFLLAGVDAGTVVTTLGGVGSTHVLATAVHAAGLGARCWAVRWPHELNAVAAAVDAAIGETCERAPVLPVPLALARLGWWYTGGGPGAGRRLQHVPFGGATPAGIAGQIEAGLELAAQVRDGELPQPARVVLPVGSGGTAAGVALGLAAAGLATEVIGVRVGPRLGVTRARVLRLARRTRHWLRELTDLALPPPAPVRLLHEYYGGAYGRPLPAGDAAASRLHQAAALALDTTYGAKAAAAALDLAGRLPGPTLLWVTFDGRDVAPGPLRSS